MIGERVRRYYGINPREWRLSAVGLGRSRLAHRNSIPTQWRSFYPSSAVYSDGRLVYAARTQGRELGSQFGMPFFVVFDERRGRHYCF